MKVRAGSQSTRTLGFVGSVAGYLIGSIGLGVFAAGVAPQGQNGNYLTDDQRNRLRVVGGLGFLGGAALALGSLYSLSQNHTTFQVKEIP